MGSEYVQMITTVDRFEKGEEIAMQLVEKNLAACVQILEIKESIYEWKGKIEKVKEYMCVIKTKKEIYKEVENEIKRLHPYTIPEIVVLPIIDGNRDYLNWIDEVTKH